MSVYFIGDPHLGHRNIHKIRECISSPEENVDLILKEWRSTITKNDVVFVMGDVAFDDRHLAMYSELKGRKVLIRGNHDKDFSTEQLLQHFEEIHGMLKYKGMWLTHCPMHPQELFGKVNVHGHVHAKSIMRGPNKFDDRYINTCIEACWAEKRSIFYTLDEIKAKAEACSMVIEGKILKAGTRPQNPFNILAA